MRTLRAIRVSFAEFVKETRAAVTAQLLGTLFLFWGLVSTHIPVPDWHHDVRAYFRGAGFLLVFGGMFWSYHKLRLKSEQTNGGLQNRLAYLESPSLPFTWQSSGRLADVVNDVELYFEWRETGLDHEELARHLESEGWYEAVRIDASPALTPIRECRIQCSQPLTGVYVYWVVRPERGSESRAPSASFSGSTAHVTFDPPMSGAAAAAILVLAKEQVGVEGAESVTPAPNRPRPSQLQSTPVSSCPSTAADPGG